MKRLVVQHLDGEGDGEDCATVADVQPRDWCCACAASVTGSSETPGNAESREIGHSIEIVNSFDAK